MNRQPDTAFFHCRYDDVLNRLTQIDPVRYDESRNYLNGAVTCLGPFVSHGIISALHIANAVLNSYSIKQCNTLLYQLAWREYFHRIWESHGDAIFSDLRTPCQSTRLEIPTAIVSANTGVQAVDDALSNLFDVGTMHNHARMWVAGMCCNMGNTHWLPAAKWMHYHLLDGDLASNTLSWQWIAGTNSHKRYVMNQDNINKFSRTNQSGTFLDTSYERLGQFNLPDPLVRTINPITNQTLPGDPVVELAGLKGTVALRSVWQLNPHWQEAIDQHVLFIDTELHNQWPMSQIRWQFILHWASFIPNLRIVKGTSKELQTSIQHLSVVRQSYPACHQWGVATEDRDWLYPNPPKPFNSFSQFWKQVAPQSRG